MSANNGDALVNVRSNPVVSHRVAIRFGHSLSSYLHGNIAGVACFTRSGPGDADVSVTKHTLRKALGQGQMNREAVPEDFSAIEAVYGRNCPAIGRHLHLEDPERGIVPLILVVV